jgi:hypothetical protein
VAAPFEGRGAAGNDDGKVSGEGFGADDEGVCEAMKLPGWPH